jgi:hypothetical protein
MLPTDMLLEFMVLIIWGLKILVLGKGYERSADDWGENCDVFLDRANNWRDAKGAEDTGKHWLWVLLL